MRNMLSLTALADPTRRQIVELLTQGEMAAGAIAERFEVSPPAISQHLKLLKEAQLVQVRVERQHRLYKLNERGFLELENWLIHMRQFWAGRLDALEQELRKDNPSEFRRHRSKRSTDSKKQRGSRK